MSMRYAQDKVYTTVGMLGFGLGRALDCGRTWGTRRLTRHEFVPTARTAGLGGWKKQRFHPAKMDLTDLVAWGGPKAQRSE